MANTWTTPAQQVTGTLITSSLYNGFIDNIDYLGTMVEPDGLANGSGGAVVAGDVVIAHQSVASQFNTTTSADSADVIGVALESIAGGATGRIGTSGVVTVNVTGAVAIGDFLSTSTTAGRAKANTNKNAGTFAVALTAAAGPGNGTVSALLLCAASGGLSDHTLLSNIGTRTHAQIDTVLDGLAATYAAIANGVTNGDSHDHSGGDGAQVDHASLANKGTNTHAQIDTALAGLASTYAPIAKGVTNGDTHDHNGGDGGQISHTALSDVGSSTHAAIDTHIAGQAFSEHAANPACRVYHSANQTVGANSWATIVFNSERFDTDAIHDTGSNTSRLTCKTAGKYAIWAHARMEYTGPVYTLALLLNGATYIAYGECRYIGDHIGLMVGSVTSIYDMAVNDYVELRIFNGDGGTSRSLYSNGNYSPEFGMVRVG